MQETPLRSLVREDTTCHGATQSVCHNYWASDLEPGAATAEPTHLSCWSLPTLEPARPQRRSLRTQLESSPHSPQLEKGHVTTKTQQSQKCIKWYWCVCVYKAASPKVLISLIWNWKQWHAIWHCHAIWQWVKTPSSHHIKNTRLLQQEKTIKNSWMLKNTTWWSRGQCPHHVHTGNNITWRAHWD